MSENTRTTLETNFKYVQKKTENLLPENSVLMDTLGPIQDADKIGRKYLAPVQLAHENGFTYGDGSAFALNDAVAGVYEEAEVDANPIVLNTKISESAANRMANKKENLAEGTLRYLGMQESMVRRCEIAMLYGQAGIATTASSANASATSTVITFTAASWSAGVAAGLIGAQLHFYNGATLVSSAADAVFTVTSVSMENRTWTVTGTATGITALDSGIASGARTAFFLGSKSNDMFGLDKQIVGGAAYFGIDPTVYNLWQGNTHSAGSAALTMAKTLKAAAKCVARGGAMGELQLHCGALTWTDLNLDQAALRSYDEGYSPKKAENGSQKLVYQGPGVTITVVLNNVCKDGEAFLLPVKYIKRIGAKDVGFVAVGQNGKGEDEYYRMMEGTAAYQLRMSAEFSVLLEMPAKACKITSIVNNS
jgi:hypothetical protein